MKELEKIRAAGQPVTLEDLDAWYPYPEQGKNAADIYQEAFDCIVRHGSEFDTSSFLFEGHPKPGSPLSQDQKPSPSRLVT